jgi:CubicO group peptidase (beta-lactamase class C family)
VKSIWRCFTIGVVSLTFWTCLSPGPRAQDLPSRMQHYLNSQVIENRFSGTVIVAHAGEVLINAHFGTSLTVDAAPNKAQDRIPVGSIEEQFIAGAILQLEKAGKLQLDTPICDFIPDCSADWSKIHLLHLLSHSSGLPSLESNPRCDENPSPLVSPEMLASFSRKPLLSKPGDKFNDNKLDYVVLRLAIEKISGQSIREYLEQNIFHPLKLKQTGYSVPVPRQNPPESGLREDCQQREYSTAPLSSHFIAGELFSNADDLYRWERALFTEEVLPKNLRDQMLVPYIDGYGFGWKIIKEFDRKVALQSDASEASSVSIRNYPDDDTCIIVVSGIKNVSSATVSHDLGSILFGKHYPSTED